MSTCITSQEPVSEDNWNALYEELRDLIEYAQAIPYAMHGIAFYEEQEGLTGEPDELLPLALLGKALGKEAQRRALQLRQAALIWEHRAKGELEAPTSAAAGKEG